MFYLFLFKLLKVGYKLKWWIAFGRTIFYLIQEFFISRICLLYSTSDNASHVSSSISFTIFLDCKFGNSKSLRLFSRVFFICSQPKTWNVGELYSLSTALSFHVCCSAKTTCALLPILFAQNHLLLETMEIFLYPARQQISFSTLFELNNDWQYSMCYLQRKLINMKLTLYFNKISQ